MGKNRGIITQRKVEGSWLLKGRMLWMQIGISVGISGLIAVLLYNSFWGMLVTPVLFYLVGFLMKKREREKLRNRLNLEFKDYMYAVSGALLAGYSVERAFLSGLRDMQQLYGDASVLVKRLASMEGRLGMQEPIERILRDFAERSDSEDIESFVEIFSYAKRGGGDFVHIIATTIERICDKIEVLEEIQTVMAEKALEQKVMCIVPLGILLFFKVTSPEFIGILYGNLLGVGIMTSALILYGIAFLLGMKIVEVEV